MEENRIISKINEYLHIATKELCSWLGDMLPKVTDDWWQQCVMFNLTTSQNEVAERNGYSKLEQLDLAALLKVTDKSWYDMRSFAYLPTSQRECVKQMMKVRNNWAHCAGIIPDKDIVIRDVYTILEFFETFLGKYTYSYDIKDLIDAIRKSDFSTIAETTFADSFTEAVEQEAKIEVASAEIKERDMVCLVSDPNTKGMVFSVSDVNGVKKYEVFVDGDIKTYYEGQIKLVENKPTWKWVDIETFKSNLTANEINNPTSTSLYSLNSARIDFVPYQFRPALKMIKSDEPRILIADSVGVGKTIEAGLIIKELEARDNLENVLIICPKPLVSERKWELEMKRFDEDFISLSGEDLRTAISDVHRDGAWPTRCSKAIIPYSILDNRVYEADDPGKGYGLLDLDPSPHFDLVIIDEAHHIRNGSLEKEKAFAYKCVRYFCEHADAVVMLTATPLQTSDDDLYTLLNLLRPDVVMDKDVFKMMSRPNEYIYRCSHAIRAANDGWQQEAIDQLVEIKSTQWGENVVARNPLYHEVMHILKKDEITREERVKLISDVESLHSFNSMINRTRRRDIQDFCVRRSNTVETEFTPEQKALHDELLRFEFVALSKLHDVRCIPFMMSTIRRQAASCIFGLVPYMKSLITKRVGEVVDDPYIDADDMYLADNDARELLSLANTLFAMAQTLPEDDPKLDGVLKIIEEKQKQDNNKIILFSTFKHTLNYVCQKLSSMNYRVAQIDGSVKDEKRRELRARFELDKDNPEAIDMLLFTEVGSEGLDYQFCDTMINYDLPWNPMRIEQRIGRIDRRGQKSDCVNIYNLITADTVDADIYHRCLSRIGVFESSIGECEEILGEIGKQIEQIAANTNLTDEERQKKLEQMADNEVRRIQELTKLEDEERSLFGFDLSNYAANKDIKDADSPWISPSCIQELVTRYLNTRLGDGQYLVGSSDLKQLRIGKSLRLILLEDFRKLPVSKGSMYRKWESYLKGNEANHQITFLSEKASEETNAFFLTPMHPLVKQAAEFFDSNDTEYIKMIYCCDHIPEGRYPFSIYAWNYICRQPSFEVVPICENKQLEEELVDILQESDNGLFEINVDDNTWGGLEELHLKKWQDAKNQYIDEITVNSNYKIESLNSNYRNRKRTLEQKIRDAFDQKIVRMYESELRSATENYNERVYEIQEKNGRADIHTSLVAKGIVEIRRG